MFKKFRQNSAASRLVEEQLYEQVVNELANGQRRNGLWAKAISNSGGLEEKAKSLYIQYRVQSIKDELTIFESLAEKEHVETEYTQSAKSIESNPKDMGLEHLINKSKNTKQIFEYEGVFIAYGKIFSSHKDAADYIVECNRYE